MMSLKEISMIDFKNMDIKNGPAGDVLRVIGIAAMGIGLVFCVGMIAGILSAHREDGGGPLPGIMIGILIAIAVIMIALSYGVYAAMKRQIMGGEGMSKRAKNGRLIMSILFGAGAAIGVALSIISSEDGTRTAFSNGPLPMPFAIILAIIIGIILPIFYWLWHKNIDEQEASAYRDGAIAGMYAYAIGLPVWWILWRGGMVPMPDGTTIYFATMFIWGGVWFWKKYL
jgi:drug/metabolite transporter (DMT)-like permease